MRHLGFAIVVCATVSSVAAQNVPQRVLPQPLTLTGCVIAGERSGTYILTDVRTSTTPVPVGTSGSSKAPVEAPFYWLDSPRKLEDHIGHRVEVIGQLTGDVDKTEVTREGGAMKVERERVKNVKIPEGTPAASETPSGTRAGYKMKVDTVLLLSRSCRESGS